MAENTNQIRKANSISHIRRNGFPEWQVGKNVTISSFRILAIRDIISFHRKTVAGLQAEFCQAVEDYLNDGAGREIQSEIPASEKLSLQVSPDIHGRALIAAKLAGQSLNQWASEVLSHAVHTIEQ